MKEIYQYEDLYNRLKDGKEVVPVSRDEVLMMTLINKLGSLGADEGTTEKLQEILDRVMTISANSEERSLKKLLDYTRTTYNWFNSNEDVTDFSGYIEFTDTSNVTNMGSMFRGCSKLTSVPLFDTSKVVNMNNMFYTCGKLTSVPLFNTSNVTNMNNMFRGCSELPEVPLFDTGKVTDMGYMLNYCTSLKEVPLFNTSNVTNMTYMFEKCTNLTSIPLFNTSNVANMSSMFYNCYNLTEVPLFDIRKVDSAYNLFFNCSKLTTCLLRNIKVNLQVGSGTSWGHLLTVDSLLHLVKELRNTGSTKTLTVGTANLEKLANIYVKTIDITDEMRAEDDLIDEKLPFEVCESTDEGAYLVKDYVALKNWTLK